MFNEESFFEKFPKDVYEICVYISRQGFCLTLVGGAVRDFLKDDILSSDLDFEIKHLFEYSEQRWERMLKRMFDGLESDLGYRVEHKGLNVFSIKTKDSELEFSSPRLEVFDIEDNSHKNFTPKYISNLDTARAFARRDFTLNSIGIYFGVSGASDEFTILDPYSGVNDLKAKELRHVSDDFSKDPVRLLRLVRFKNRFNLVLAKTTVAELPKFNLSKISAHYVKTEFYKLGDLIFFKELFDIIDTNNIVCEEGFKNLRPLGDIDIADSLVEFSKDNFIEWLCLHNRLTSVHKRQIVTYFGLSLKFADKLINVSELHNSLNQDEIISYTEFFKSLFSMELSSTPKSQWLDFKEQWLEGVKSFRPTNKSKAAEERKDLYENLTKNILSGK